jgi:hypothetical protein
VIGARRGQVEFGEDVADVLLDRAVASRRYASGARNGPSCGPLPSTAWSLLSAATLIAGFGVLYTLIRAARPPYGAALFGVLFGLQLVAGFLPGNWSDQVSKYLPGPAGLAITSVRPDPVLLGPWTGFGLLCLYSAIVLGIAAWLLRRRDT